MFVLAVFGWQIVQTQFAQRVLLGGHVQPLPAAFQAAPAEVQVQLTRPGPHPVAVLRAAAEGQVDGTARLRLGVAHLYGQPLQMPGHERLT